MKFIKYMITEQKIITGVFLCLIFIFIFSFTGNEIFLMLGVLSFMIPLVWDISTELPKVLKRDYKEWKKKKDEEK